MKKIQTYLAIVACMLCLNSIGAQNDLSKLIEEFSKTDWKVVKQAKLNIENQQGDAIPYLLKLLSENRIVKIENTGSLIYPGAEKFFGYGQIVDYDIDNLAIRAGWALEDISFMNLGFSGYHLPKEELESFVKITFPAYYNNANNRKKLDSSTEAELRDIIFKLSVKKANDWWQKEKDGWSRLQSLVDGLSSFDEKRQVKALFYMRNGETACTGLTKDYYIDNISKEIVRLGSSDTQRVSEHARLILFDTKFLWLENKNNN